MVKSAPLREVGGNRKATDKKLTAQDRRLLANLPQAEVKAFNTLVAYGVDGVKLCKLIKTRKRPVGRPPKADETARLVASIDRYLMEHPKASLQDAFDALLEPMGSYKRLSRTQRDKKRRSVEVAYSREIKKRKAQESEPMSEYASRRKREMRELQSATDHKTPPKS